MTDLQDGLRALDVRIREEVLEHHAELVQQSRHIQALEAAMQTIGASVSSLQDSIARAQQEVMPYSLEQWQCNLLNLMKFKYLSGRVTVVP